MPRLTINQGDRLISIERYPYMCRLAGGHREMVEHEWNPCSSLGSDGYALVCPTENVQRQGCIGTFLSHPVEIIKRTEDTQPDSELIQHPLADSWFMLPPVEDKV